MARGASGRHAAQRLKIMLGTAAVVFIVLAASASFASALNIEVQALFPSAAVIKVNGDSKMLRQGQSLNGVTLIGADSKAAIIEFNGERHSLGMSKRITANYTTPSSKQVTISRNGAMQYYTNATINGRGQLVLVDTGANVVALNESQADAMGVEYKTAKRTRVETASGIILGWAVVLNSVDVGGIRVDHVDATVLEGDFPGTVLLGMSYLKHVKLQEHNGILSLSRDF